MNGREWRLLARLSAKADQSPGVGGNGIICKQATREAGNQVSQSE